MTEELHACQDCRNYNATMYDGYNGGWEPGWCDVTQFHNLRSWPFESTKCQSFTPYREEDTVRTPQCGTRRSTLSGTSPLTAFALGAGAT